jgi:enamine deaminase RidA (YjgF/YER057c/UK114 family)
MTVADFQQVLQNLARTLDAAGANRTTVGELTGFADQLARHRDLKLKALGDLIARPDPVGPVGPKPVRPTPAKGSAVSPEAVAAEAARLYSRAADPTVPDEQYAALAEQLGQLTGPGLKTVAAAIELKFAARDKKVEQMRAAIVSRIEDRRGASIRAKLLNPPPPAG